MSDLEAINTLHVSVRNVELGDDILEVDLPRDQQSLVISSLCPYTVYEVIVNILTPFTLLRSSPMIVRTLESGVFVCVWGRWGCACVHVCVCVCVCVCEVCLCVCAYTRTSVILSKCTNMQLCACTCVYMYSVLILEHLSHVCICGLCVPMYFFAQCLCVVCMYTRGTYIHTYIGMDTYVFCLYICTVHTYVCCNVHS